MRTALHSGERDNDMSLASRIAALAAAGFTLAAAHAGTSVFTATLSGPAESPPNESPGTGTAIATFDLDAMTMRIQAEFEGLLAPVTICHTHGPTMDPFMGTAGVMTPVPLFPGFPTGVTEGTYDMTFDMTMASSYNPAFLTLHSNDIPAAFDALYQAHVDGRAYFNIHTSMFMSGEIRGFFIPSPGGAAAMMVGAGLLGARRRRA